MSPQKTTALILSVLPYRETSAIIRVLTPEHGLVSAVAKGMLRRGSKAIYIDRGFLVEMLLYFRANRDLHTAGTIHPSLHYPSIRADLTKTMIRDAAFELILKSLTQSASHPEAFDLAEEFLDRLETSDREVSFPVLWHFIISYCDGMGFGIDLQNCLSCATPLHNKSASLLIDRGGMVCPGCAVQHNLSVQVSDGILSIFQQTALPRGFSESPGECLRITKMLYSWCRYHFDIRAPFNSIDFLESMI